MDETVVVYSTKHGICEHAAQQLAKNLGCPYQDVENIRSIEQFENVILGTSIYAGKPTKSMQVFLAAHKQKLLTKKIAVFIVCSYSEPWLIQKQIEAAFPKEILDAAFFAGCIANGVNMDKLGFVEKKIFTKVSGINQSYFNFNGDEVSALMEAYKRRN